MGDVGVVHMGAVEQLPQFLGGGGRVCMVDCIGGLTRGHMMGTRSDAADTRHDARQFFYGPALAELLKAAKLRYLEVGILNLTVTIEKNLYLAVSFKPGYGVDTNLSNLH